MKIIISPAKKMNVDTDTMAVQGSPAFLSQTEVLLEWMRGLSREEAKKLWKCNDALTQLNYDRFREMDLEYNLTPALLSYEGIQYQYMAPHVFTEDAWEYVQKNLRILSGFYGVLKPLDGVTPYRLEMQAKVKSAGKKDLYEFWGSRLYDALTKDRADGNPGKCTIMNLASKEYSRCVEQYLQPGDRFVTCIFGEWKDGKVIQKGTQAKMARGEMVRFMAENRVETPEDIRGFDRMGYEFRPELSSDHEYIFVKKGVF